ncbi:unnamed protein product (macronuclear) [Paramecium tetraurelia]|uniref:Uncharacterized protein n=1 Tax=Paramecium tetraurelia TaxID=5888 RepID=A0C4A0_PARTE|nr:uncharacterized protein GSPATT00035097001 [Paramecium tetraurelia]CAK65617.1 unnamed protein product [Paramecium tetraurelia]|eukprot:XP_001433014.1 hypothetical protein (macronuclear) [Paramecium tetraurelia strain d4-2]
MIDRSYQLNSSYDSQVTLPPRNKQFSPVVTQLMRKDREIEQMRDELSQQNYLIDELSQQIHFLEHQLRDNEGFKEKYQSLTDDQNQQQKDVQKQKVSVQTTTAKEILNLFLEQEKQGEDNVQFKYIETASYFKSELQESVNRELEQKQVLDNFIKQCTQMNEQIISKNQQILQLTLEKQEEILSLLIKKEDELLFYKEKSRVFYELLQCNMDITKLYQKQNQGLRQALKGCWTINLDQSQQIESLIKLLDNAHLERNSLSVKPILDQIKYCSNQNYSNKRISQLEIFIDQVCQVEGKTAFDKVQNIILQLDQYQQICQNVQDEKQEIIEELQFYKNKLMEQDETIKEFEKLLTEMEANFHQQLQTQTLQLNEINQKNELIAHYQLILDDYKSQMTQKLDQKMINEQQGQNLNEQSLEEILKIITMILQGYNTLTNDYQLNIDISGINVNKKVHIDINPVIHNYISKIQQQVNSQFMITGKNYYELTNHMVNCLQVMKQQLPQHQLKNFINNASIEYIEKFNQISYCYFVKQEKLTSFEKDLYRKYYTYIPRLLGELIENQTQTFIKLLREKVYNSIISDPIVSNKPFQS